jgi:transmembrane sensor
MSIEKATTTHSTTEQARQQDILQQATIWVARLWAENVSPADIAACNEWRNAEAEHEIVWQKLQMFDNKIKRIANLSVRSNVLNKQPISLARRQLLLQGFVLTIGTGTLYYGVPRSQLWQHYTADYASNIGETRTVILQDGTEIILNTNTAISFAMNNTSRKVTLHYGEVLITTAKDIKPNNNIAKNSQPRDFIVVTQQGVVQALGTRFSVKQNAESTSVAVFESAVLLKPNSLASNQASNQVNNQVNNQANNKISVLRLAAGQGTVFTENSIAPVNTVNANSIAWSKGKLVAERMRLADFADEISRYRPGIVRCQTDVSDLRVTGVFSLSDTDVALNSLAKSLPISIRYRTKYWVNIGAG